MCSQMILLVLVLDFLVFDCEDEDETGEDLVPAPPG
jgi:hypothetical protein